jgi:hypothetical protein
LIALAEVGMKASFYSEINYPSFFVLAVTFLESGGKLHPLVGGEGQPPLGA